MYYIGVDIGGTFTDCVLVDEAGGQERSKALSDKADPPAGVFAALDVIARRKGIGLSSMLARTSRFSHGTTIGTNAVLERRGARVGLVTTAGHRDSLAMMRGHGRVAGLPVEQVFSVHETRLPSPLIIDGAIAEIDERVDSDGEIVCALDEDAAMVQILELVETYALDSVTVVLLWSFANPDHERRLRNRLTAEMPGVYVSVSHEVSPRLGEYERTVATVMNGYIGPASSMYLSDLRGRLSDSGLSGGMYVMQSNGGVAVPERAAISALGMIDSGPTGGLTATEHLARVYGHHNVVATDMGGTSFDIGLVIDGRAQLAEENTIDQYTYRLPHLDVRTIACGGGTLASIDDVTESLRVGPQSAGSEPGPACYGNGGTLPTVTDADVVLGLLRAEAFLGGRMPLDVAAARSAVGELAVRLGLPIEDTAAGIIEINNMRAAAAIRQQTLERGRDPRDFALYAYGGAGPVHAFGFAAEIGTADVVIPQGDGASTMSAYGIGSGDLKAYAELERRLAAPFDLHTLTAAVDEVAEAARTALASSKAAGETPLVQVSALMRFGEQLMHSLEIPIVQPITEATPERVLADFSAEYAHRYGAGAAGFFQAAEVFAFRAHAWIPSQIPSPQRGHEVVGAPAPESFTQVEVYWPGIREWFTTDVFRLDALQCGDQILGPALIESAHTSIAVPPGGRARLGRHRELHLRLDDSSRTDATSQVGASPQNNGKATR
ncbi:hydantoinase/oxoprolinase family protein [Gordonia sp. VNK21]|uniref:hydantoinase/oxoprolinase family protein n=1 Tax=Gordonia sp. VNK21 TaxID=3382483 RepID=UPI0038D516A0